MTGKKEQPAVTLTRDDVYNLAIALAKANGHPAADEHAMKVLKAWDGEEDAPGDTEGLENPEAGQ